MKPSKPFKLLTVTTYLPMPLLGIMVLFGVGGKLFHVGWLESAPDVLLIPTLILYYVSLIMGAIYGYLKKEDTVYMMALIGLAVWIVGIILSKVLSLPREAMVAINIIIIAAILVLHIFQYVATKKWEARINPSAR